MMKVRAKLPASFGQRCRTLGAAAQDVRQQATREGDDFEGWCLSRLMRDADTDALLNAAELKYGIWLQLSELHRAR
jgi:hypothetical protein